MLYGVQYRLFSSAWLSSTPPHFVLASFVTVPDRAGPIHAWVRRSICPLVRSLVFLRARPHVRPSSSRLSARPSARPFVRLLCLSARFSARPLSSLRSSAFLTCSSARPRARPLVRAFVRWSVGAIVCAFVCRSSACPSLVRSSSRPLVSLSGRPFVCSCFFRSSACFAVVPHACRRVRPLVSSGVWAFGRYSFPLVVFVCAIVYLFVCVYLDQMCVT